MLAGGEEDGDPELVANLTLASLVLQLASLARQAEDMFGELEAEVRAVEDTSRRIRQRVSGLRVTVARLDCLEEEVASLESCWEQEARSRDRGEDTGLLTPATRPRHLARGRGRILRRPTSAFRSSPSWPADISTWRPRLSG